MKIVARIAMSFSYTSYDYGSSLNADEVRL
jgi:hypothetical protein